MPRTTTLSRSINGKVALVTGAGSGMGRATAMLLADEGAVVAVSDQDGDASSAVSAEIQGAGGRAAAWTLDVRDADAVRDTIADVVARFGALDILVNNAGVSLPGPIDAEGYEAVWETTLDVNLTAYTRTVRAALPSLLASVGGRIVNVASTEGLGATRSLSAYTAAKHGVIGLTRALAVELGARGITVNCVCPGPINTAMTASIPDDAKATFARRKVPLRRYGDAEEVAHAIVSLTLPAMSYVNGAVLVVDGGMTAKND